MKLDILAFGAHPDDVELGCAGVLAKEIANGKKIGIIDLTQGEMGTRGSKEIRAKEAENAAKIIGTQLRKNLNFKDAFIKNDELHQFEIIKFIRKYQPEVVFCNAIEDRHIDHGTASKLVSDACFLSGLKKLKTSIGKNDQKAWRPKKILHYIQWKDIEPDIVIDISGFLDIKKQAVMAYASQFYSKENNNSEPQTPISSSNFLDSVTYRAQNLGRLVGTDYAEGFTLESYPAINSVFDLI